jgi:hypothetical protein
VEKEVYADARKGELRKLLRRFGDDESKPLEDEKTGEPSWYRKQAVGCVGTEVDTMEMLPVGDPAEVEPPTMVGTVVSTGPVHPAQVMLLYFIPRYR